MNRTNLLSGIMLFLAVVFFAPMAWAVAGETVDVKGQIRDLRGAPVSGVLINVWDGRNTFRTSSNAGGRYEIPGVKKGAVLAFRWERRGFSPARVDGVRIPADGDLFISTEYGTGAVGDTLALRLATNPSTGYSWSLRDPGDRSIALGVGNLMEASDEKTDPRGSVGRGGHELWLFRALKKGRSTVVLAYGRNWEESIPPNRISVMVISVR